MKAGLRAGLFSLRRRDEVLAAIALEIEQRREIGVSDDRIGERRDPRFAAIGDPEAGGLDHRDVVRAVADRQGLAGRKPHFGTSIEQRRPLGRGIDDRGRNTAAEAVADEREAVGPHGVESETLGHRLGKKREAARDEQRAGAGGRHRAHQRLGPGARPHALLKAAPDIAEREPGEQGDARAQGSGEIGLATHGGFGHPGHLRLAADEVGELVDAFDRDHRRIHVGDEQPLAAPLDRLHRAVGAMRGGNLPRDRPRDGKRQSGKSDIECIGTESLAPRDPCPGAREGLFERGRGRVEHTRVRLDDERGHAIEGRIRHEGGNPGVNRRAVLIAGPTASGKSALALALAERHRGVVINADSMQVYRDLAILTARPDAATMARAPHRLYGILDAADACSVGRWHDLARTGIEAAWRAGRLPILVGGTGLYFRALLHGLAPVPAIPHEVRARIRERLAIKGPEALHHELAERDPAMAARLRPTDSQRIVRALEVIEATGRSLAAYQETTEPGALRDADREGRVLKVVLDLAREELYRRIDARFLAMIERGALEEVRRLVARGLDPGLPAMKALGVAPLARHLAGVIDRAEAVRLGRQESRRYAKRQMTWFRTQAGDWPRLAGEDKTRALDRLEYMLGAMADSGRDSA